MSRIELTIDRLVLREFDPGQAQSLVGGLRSELPRLLATREHRSAWARSHRTPALRLGGLPLGPGASGAARCGAALARGIGRGLKP